MWMKNLFIVTTMLFCCYSTGIHGNSFESKQATANPSHRFNDLIKKKYFHVNMSRNNLRLDHNASTLVITCVDFRFQDEFKSLLDNELALKDDYDLLELPGASLGFSNTQYPGWNESTEEVISLLQKLHHIQKIIFLDHRDCGAYTLILGKQHGQTADNERQSHQTVMARCKSEINKEFPHLKVYFLLMGLDGTVENLSHE